MTYKSNLITGMILMIVSTAYYALSFQIEVFGGSGATALDSRFMPRVWSALLFVLSIILIIRSMKQRKKHLSKEDVNIKRKRSFMTILKENREVAMTFIALAIYIVGLQRVGFLIMSVLYLFFQILILTNKEKRNLLLAGIVSIVFAVGINYIFVVWLRVMLPRGIIGF
jgi:hypothetical protein